MLKLKWIATFVLELLVEAVFLGSLMGLLISGRTGLYNGIIGSILSVPVILALHGYYILRVVSVVVRNRFSRWLYPLLACFIFAGDAWFAFWQMRASLSPLAESVKVPFVIGGVCIVFISTLAGTLALRRWTATINGQPESAVLGR